MKNEEIVSVVIPIYNTEKYLDDCIKSVVMQSYQNLEIILVNDGSKDNSQEIIEKWCLKDSRVKYVEQENAGVTKARAKGVSLATGKWVCFVDADDVLPEDSIALLISHSLNQDIVIGQVEFSLPKWPYPRLKTDLTNVQYLKILLKRKEISWAPFAKLYLKNLFNDFIFNIPPQITHGEDFLMNLRLGARAKKIRVIDNVVYQYLYRNDSAMSQNPFRSILYSIMFEKYVWVSLKRYKRRLVIPLFINYMHRCFTLIKENIKPFVLKLLAQF